MTIVDALKVAIPLHEAGRFAEAEDIYRKILAEYPENPATLHLLGVLTHQLGRTEEGIKLVARAILIKRDPEYYANLGELLRSAGQIDRGIESCWEAIKMDPRHSIAYQNLAALQEHAGKLDEALGAARQGVFFAPKDPNAHRILGSVFYHKNMTSQALSELAEALRLNPKDGGAYALLGSVYEKTGHMDHALSAFERAVQLTPRPVGALFQLGRHLQMRGRYTQALACFENLLKISPPSQEMKLRTAGCLEGLNRFDEAIALCKGILKDEPRNATAHCIIGIARFQSGRLDEAEAGLRAALKIVDDPDLHSNLATTLVRKGRLEEALQEINIAVQRRPEHPETVFAKSLILLFMGRFEEAWPIFEWRWKHPRMDTWRHATDKPVWDGSPLEGKKILLYAEQGLGDTIHYARYATLVAERGGRVIMEVQQGLREVIQTVPGVEQCIVRGEAPGEFDTLCPLLSLPGVFRTNLQTIPAKVPYVSTDPARVEKWRSIIGDSGGKLKVGLVWRGGDFLREDHLRSTTLAALSPLAGVPGVRFYSLQKGPGAAEANTPPAQMDFVNLDPHIADFADTAAAISLLDLVISVDTAVIHLAGAMAHPVWALISRHTTHTWLTERSDSPWYPTMRLFREIKLGDWPGAIQWVASELAKFVAAR